MRISDWSSDVCSSDLNRITSPPCLVERILPDGPARSRQRDRAASRHPYDRSSARTKTVMSMTMHEDDDLARWLRLTEKQRACLDLLIERKTSKEIARILGISKPTVDQRITAARIILGAANRHEAALIYARLKQLYDRITYDSVQVPSPPTLVPSDFPDGDPEPVLKLSDSAAPTFGAGQGSRAFFLPFREIGRAHG